jgi:hypothetical protein
LDENCHKLIAHLSARNFTVIASLRNKSGRGTGVEAKIYDIETSYTEDTHEIHLKRYLEESQSKRILGTRLKVSFLCLFVAMLAVLPFHIMGRRDSQNLFWKFSMPITHDMHLHLEQMKSFYTGLSAGKIYPRWEEDTNRGFGAITTSYYPPAIYYVTSVFYFIFGDWLVSIFCTHLLLMIAAGAAMYLYARQFVGVKSASTAMCAYMILPYHLVDQYQRGALAELLSFIWMPMMLWFCEKLYRRKSGEGQKKKNWVGNLAGLAACYGAFLWSHPPTAYQFSLAFGLYLVGLTILRKDLRGLTMVAGGLALGVLLSAAYMLPAYLESDLVRTKYISETWPYHNTYVFYHNLPYLNGNLGFFRLIDTVWVFSAFVFLSCAIFFLVQRRNLSATFLRRGWLWIAMGGFVCLMMLRISEPLGRLIPKIDIGVFTWRMLGIATLVSALTAALFSHLAFESKNNLNFQRSVATFITGLIVVGGAFISFFAVIKPMVYAPLFIPETEHMNFATIPVGAPEDPLEQLPYIDRTAFVSGVLGNSAGEVEVERWLPESRRLRVKIDHPDRLRIRTFNSPGWVAKVDGREIPIITGSKFGEINLDLPPGESQIELEYMDTPVRRTAERITQISFLFLLLLIGTPLIYRSVKPTI